MTQRAEKILSEIRALDTEERLELVAALYDEFGPKDPGYEAAWAAEIRRREERIDAGGGKFVPAEEVLDKNASSD